MRHRFSAQLGLLAFVGLTAAVAAVARAGTVIQSTSAPVQVEVPAGWSQVHLKAEAIRPIALTVTDAEQASGINVLFQAGNSTTTLDAFAKETVGDMSKKLTGPAQTDWVKTVSDGCDALRCELTGSLHDHAIGYVITVVKTGAGFDVIIGFAPGEQFAASKPVLGTISDSFKQLGNVPPATGNPTVVKGRSGNLELRLPAGWTQLAVPAAANYEVLASDSVTGALVDVKSDPRRPQVTLAAYGDSVIKAYEKTDAAAKHTDWEAVTISGLDARRCEVHATFGGMKLGCTLTVIETATHRYRTLTWIDDSAFEKTKPTLLHLSDGFKEVSLAK